MYSFDPHTLLWSKISYSFGGIPRRRAAAAALSVPTQQIMYLFGGRTTQFQNRQLTHLVVGQNDLWSFDANTNTWFLLPVTEKVPSPRQFAAMTYFENKLFVFGSFFIYSF
jgi:hypothetical protein